MSNIIDAHAHIGSLPSLSKSKRDLIRGMDRADVASSIISCADVGESHVEAGSPHKALSMVQGLKECFKLEEENPGRIHTLCWIAPQNEGITPSFLEFFKANLHRIKGLKFHPYSCQMDINDPRVGPFLQLAREYSLPVLVHTAVDEFSNFDHFVTCCKNHKDINFVAAHLELYGDSYAATDKMSDLDNAYADTAWVNFDVANRFLEKLGPTRLMFGSDAPVDGYMTLLNPLYIPYYENAFGLSEDDYALLMEGNAKRIYKL